MSIFDFDVMMLGLNQLNRNSNSGTIVFVTFFGCIFFCETLYLFVSLVLMENFDPLVSHMTPDSNNEVSADSQSGFFLDQVSSQPQLRILPSVLSQTLETSASFQLGPLDYTDTSLMEIQRIRSSAVPSVPSLDSHLPIVQQLSNTAMLSNIMQSDSTKASMASAESPVDKKREKEKEKGRNKNGTSTPVAPGAPKAAWASLAQMHESRKAVGGALTPVLLSSANRVVNDDFRNSELVLKVMETRDNDVIEKGAELGRSGSGVNLFAQQGAMGNLFKNKVLEIVSNQGASNSNNSSPRFFINPKVVGDQIGTPQNNVPTASNAPQLPAGTNASHLVATHLLMRNNRAALESARKSFVIHFILL